MEYRQLGRAGLRVSAVGLGTNQFGGIVDQAGVNEIVHEALDLGINFLDTADSYANGRSEQTLGIGAEGTPPGSAGAGDEGRCTKPARARTTREPRAITFLKAIEASLQPAGHRLHRSLPDPQL